MVPIGILSVIALALILVYLFSLRRGAIVTSRYMAAAEALLRTRDYMGLLAFSSRHNEVIACVMHADDGFCDEKSGIEFCGGAEDCRNRRDTAGECDGPARIAASHPSPILRCGGVNKIH